MQKEKTRPSVTASSGSMSVMLMGLAVQPLTLLLWGAASTGVYDVPNAPTEAYQASATSL
jgi:hypothetical protein